MNKAQRQAIDALRERTLQQALFGHKHTHDWKRHTDVRFVYCGVCKVKALADCIDNPRQALRRVREVVGEEQICKQSLQFSNVWVTALIHIADGVRWRRVHWSDAMPEYNLLIALPATRVADDAWKQVGRRHHAVPVGVTFDDLRYKATMKAARKNIKKPRLLFYRAVMKAAHQGLERPPWWWDRYTDESW